MNALAGEKNPHAFQYRQIRFRPSSYVEITQIINLISAAASVIGTERNREDIPWHWELVAHFNDVRLTLMQQNVVFYLKMIVSKSFIQLSDL